MLAHIIHVIIQCVDVRAQACAQTPANALHAGPFGVVVVVVWRPQSHATAIQKPDAHECANVPAAVFIERPSATTHSLPFLGTARRGAAWSAVQHTEKYLVEIP